MATIADIRARVAHRLKDGAQAIDGGSGSYKALDAAILSAVEEYGKVRPAKATASVTGAGTHKYSLTAATPVVTGFSAGLSIIRSIVYPYVAASQELIYRESDEWQITDLSDGLYLWFLAASPTAAETFLVSFTKPHTCSATDLTVDASDYEAVADLAASHALTVLANFYVQSVDATIQADSVNRLSKSGEYRAMAKAYRDSYKLKMASGASTGGAMAIGDIDRLATNRRQYLFHDSRTV